MKLDESSFNRHSSNQIGYNYHNEEKQTNEIFTMQDISVDGNIIMNVNLKSAMYPYNFIRNLNRCYDISGMSLSTASGNNVIYTLKLNVKNISDISKLKGLKQVAIEHIYFSLKNRLNFLQTLPILLFFRYGDHKKCKLF